MLGWTVDSLLGAEVVLATGLVVNATSTSNADLLFALKGGGANYGM